MNVENEKFKADIIDMFHDYIVELQQIFFADNVKGIYTVGIKVII